MIVAKGTGPAAKPYGNPEGINLLRRRIFVTDKDGVEHEIYTQADLKRILDQMTPEQQKEYKNNYRFCPVTNLTHNPNYTGVVKDLF